MKLTHTRFGSKYAQFEKGEDLFDNRTNKLSKRLTRWFS